MSMNLNWEVVEKPLYSNFKEISGYKALYRSDTEEILHVCKSTYTPTLNSQFLEVVERFSDITGFPIMMIDEVAGGKKILAFLKCSDSIKIHGHEFKDFLMVGNSHDGSTGFFIGNSNIMVRCENRFTKNFKQMQVYHTKNQSFRIDNISKDFDFYLNKRQQFYDRFAEYVDFEVVDEDKERLVHLIAEVSPEERKGEKQISTRKQNIITDIHESIETECKDLGSNVFGLFNGVTHYTTHKKKQKEAIFGNALGTVADINNKALQFCENLLIH